jgi:hypothetical protein
MTYWHSARARAARRKSAWNLLLIPSALIPWFAGWWLSASAVGRLYRVIHPDARFVVVPDSIGGLLIALGLLFAWCPIAMIVGNVIVHAVPPARRALDQEGSTTRGTGFRGSNRALLRLAAVLIPLGTMVGIAGLFV